MFSHTVSTCNTHPSALATIPCPRTVKHSTEFMPYSSAWFLHNLTPAWGYIITPLKLCCSPVYIYTASLVLLLPDIFLYAQVTILCHGWVQLYQHCTYGMPTRTWENIGWVESIQAKVSQCERETYNILLSSKNMHAKWIKYVHS